MRKSASSFSGPSESLGSFPILEFPSHVDFKRCREEIASALNAFGNRWCKRESVECNCLKEWNLSIFNTLD